MCGGGRKGGNGIEVQAEKRALATKQAHDVVLTSMRLQYDHATSVRRHLDVMYRLGTYYS